MKKTHVIVLAVAAFFAIVAIWAVRVNNNLVTAEETVSKSWSQVENVYQRRADLIPNLVNTVKGAADFEQNTITQVIEMRANANAVKLDADNLTEANIAEFQNAQNQLSDAIGKAINITVERYPELAATQAFRDLQVQLEGTENRISVERNKFNDAVLAYNTMLRKFPNNIIASMLGFEKKSFFTAAPNAGHPVEVDF